MQSRLYTLELSMIVDGDGIVRRYRNQSDTSEEHARWLAQRDEPDSIFVSHTYFEQS